MIYDSDGTYVFQKRIIQKYRYIYNLRTYNGNILYIKGKENIEVK